VYRALREVDLREMHGTRRGERTTIRARRTTSAPLRTRKSCAGALAVRGQDVANPRPSRPVLSSGAMTGRHSYVRSSILPVGRDLRARAAAFVTYAKPGR
jgi:hypothetical protein